MCPNSTPCGHGSHHLYVLKTDPLQIFIIEPLIGQHLKERLIYIVMLGGGHETVLKSKFLRVGTCIKTVSNTSSH